MKLYEPLTNVSLSTHRVLFYRDGISDGNFQVADSEVEIMKTALEKSLGDCIPVTFVICQSQVGFRMVPAELTRNQRTNKPINNVPRQVQNVSILHRIFIFPAN